MSGGHSSNVHFNRRYYCSRYPFVAPRGEVIGTGTNHYDVIYSTSGDANNLGFQFFYEVTPIGCGAIFNDPSGRLTSPNFPENYPSHMFCVYDILQPNDGQGIRLTFDEFNVENVASRTDCGFDVVRIYEYFNNEKDHGKMLGEYCGIKVPPPLLTESNRLSLVFLSDRSVSGRGFSAHWDSVNLTLDCDRTFTEDSGVIEFNSTNYQRATSCSFKISLSDVNRIRLTVENMSLPCDVGKLMIRNGPDQLSPGFSGLQGNSEMCNTQMLQHLQSQGDTIYMRLNLKSSDPVYFRISYERIASSCGGYIYGFNGAISAPQYPEVDSRHLNCEWQIGTAHGNKIRLQFMRIDNLDSADSAGFCQPFARNYIDVTSSKSPDATIIKRYCRREASPMPIDSEDNNLVIRYNQNGGSIHGGLFGFLAQFTTLCEDIELTESDGVIQSPGFSHKVGEERECSWRIKTTPGARLKIVFSYFKIQDVSYRRYGTNGLECLSNYLEIDRTQINNTVGSVQGVQSLDMSNRRFCSWVAEPREIITKSNEFKLNFQSNGQTENHFWLTWSTVGCGGHVINNGSQILVNVTDFVPVSLSSRRRCDWVVHAPVGYVARVDIAELYTLAIVSDKGALCRRNQSNPNEFNGLEFYSGSVANNPEIDYAQQSYCGDIHNVSYFSHTNELLIRLDFNASQTQHLNDVVFRAKVSFVKPQLNNSCGGIVKIPINQNVTIRSPQYPKQYPRSIECVWQFETEPGYTISYNLSRYATPNQHARTKAYGIHRPVGNTRCSQALGYIEGSISFYAGEYNRQTFVGTGLATKDALQRICVDIDAPVLVDSHHNVSTVTFNGGPYEPSIASGDAAKVAIIGFELEVFATCGGTLTADSKRRVYPIRHNAHTNGSCHLRVERKEEVPIYVRFELVRFNQYADTNLALGIKGTCGGVTREYRQQSYTNLITMKCDGPLDFEVSNIPAELEFLVHYDTESDFCGGSLQAKVGMVNLGKLEGAVDCEYKLFMPEGNQVTVMIMNTYIEKSDYCAESFVEVREFNSTGKLMARLCGLIGFQQFRHSGLYVRIRRTTSLGALTVPMSSTTTSITVPDDDYTNEEDGAPSDVLSRDAKFSFLYTKEFGSSIIGTSGLIELPSHHESFVIRSFVYPAVAWQITGTESSYYIRLKFVRRFYVDLEIYDHFCDKDVCRASGTEPKYRLTDENPFDPADAGATTRVEEYVIESNAVTICISNVEKLSQMKVYWDQVPPDYANQTNGIQTEAGKSEFTCGSELSVAYEPKNLILPTENGVYADNMRCKWKIKRPMLGGITFTFKKLDMETTESCDYDYVVITSRDVDSVKELDEATHLIRYCQKDQINSEHQINYDQYAFVYFISDRTRGFSGFTLEYKIGCRTFEYIEASRGIFDIVHDSPSYPNTYRQAYHCLSGMVLESNRDVNITVVDMDLAPRNSSGKCDIDALSISDMPMSMRSEKKVNEICGQEKFNFTAKSGRIFIQFDSSASSTARRGYRLRVQEIIHDCGSQIIHVDEHTKYYELTSPEYPHVAPNSLDCRWILSVPPGHQVKFTVDPSTFNLMNSNNMTCDDDYMEIYDGASAGSPLIGRYCNQYGPSTIISSNSHLFVRFTTDYYVQSWGWRANVSLASCGGSLVLRPEQNATIRSPNFPLYYPSHETCEWHIRPPKAHIIHAHFNYMYLFYSENCTQDSVSIREVNSTGRELLSPSCMLRQLDSPDFYTSDMAYIRFKSNSTSLTQNRMFCPNKKCGFELEFSLEKQECGGLITDDEGVRYMHTKNDKVIPGLSCRFDFRAGIGNRYRIEFFFVNEDDEEHGFYHRWNPFYKNNEMDWCFPDLDIWNGPQENRYSYYLSSYRFCKNQTIFVSSTDILSMAYEDRLPVYEEQRSEGLYNLNKSRQYQPFGFRYQKVDQDFDSKSCMFHITENSNITIANMSYYIRSNEPSDNSNTFCHIRIDNPHRTMTVHLAFKDFRAGRRDMNWCSTNDNRVRITDSATASWPIDELLCTSRVKNGTIDFTYTTPLLEIFVSNNPFTYTGSYDTTVRFNLTVSYHACGGHINSEFSGNSGRIQSPGTYRGNYTSNADCLWILEAPEGQVVSLNITRLDLEFVVDCNNDFLEISEGQDRHAVIVRLCHEEEPRSDFQLQDRFRTYKSHGRYMTLYFHSNAEIERRGFELKWEFTHFDNGTCGFTAHSETGVVHSPNYPLDYPNNAQCQWFIIVPPGFHIRLIFTYFDVETSLQCYKDKVNITQEHNSREYDPLVTYYFYYDHEEAIGGSLCGTDLPKPIETEANQLRVYFSSDAQTTGRGFEMQWQAVCGTTYRLNHGVISSPHHPKYYPNEDMDCNYLIDPETDGKVQIITLRVVEADLDDTLVTTKRRCNADFLEITDVTQRRVVMTICGNSFNAGSSSNVISIKGPIGVRFVSNSSVMHEKRKNHRGFRITYATADCGGEINLAEAQNRLSNTISSPGFPLPYHDSLDCVWNVTAPVGYVIAVKFTAINLEESDNCIFDYVELYDGPTLSNETSFGRLCGPVSPHGHRVTTSNHAILHFVSDSSSNANGFFAVFTATLGEDSGCGGNLNATENWQTLIPPLDANGNYHNNLRCLWKINTIDPTGRRIQLRINDFNLETRRRTNQSNLCYDFLAVYDGYKTISPFLIRPMCELPNNAELPLHYTSSFYKVEVYFETDNSDAFTGFNISYRTLNNSESCDGLYYPKTEEAEITYEGEKTLTRTNQQHKRCRYFFVVDTKEPMEITFKSFNFPSRTSDCADEYMEIRNIGASANCQHPACANKNDDMKEAVRFCQNHAPTRWVSKSAFVQIVTSEVLQSEYAASFAFTYKVLDSCNRTITITPGDRWASGRITSPNYPNSYDDNSTCTTEILAPNDQQILLVFKDFVVERAAQSRQPFNRRFGIVYNRYQRYGSIPNSYATCAHDSLTIMYNTSDPMDNGTFCGYYVPPARISSSNIMTLIFRTDGDVSYGGYSANYYTARIIEENDYNKFYDFAPIYEIEGVFANIGFPGYNENTTQRWQVVPPAGMDCTFKIVVHMSNTRFCNEDEYSKWVHYEGTTPPTEWTKLPCQDVNMEVKIPSGERAMFEFKSDSNRRNNGMGLKVLWTCIDSTTPVYMIEDTTDSGSRA
ncbi:putative cubilin [Aphelenchoides besseyi]|nr:putative cubilin [Aphelenchoides besseyi]